MITGIVDIIDSIFVNSSIPSSGLIRRAFSELLDSSVEAVIYVILGGVLGECLDAYLEWIFDIKQIAEVSFASLLLKILIHIAGILVIMTSMSELVSRIPSPFSGQVGKSVGMMMLFTTIAWRSPHLHSVADEILDRIHAYMRSQRYISSSSGRIQQQQHPNEHFHNNNQNNIYFPHSSGVGGAYPGQEMSSSSSSAGGGAIGQTDFMQRQSALYHL